MLTPEREKEIREFVDASMSLGHACFTAGHMKEILAEIDRLREERENGKQAIAALHHEHIQSLDEIDKLRQYNGKDLEARVDKINLAIEEDNERLKSQLEYLSVECLNYQKENEKLKQKIEEDAPHIDRLGRYHSELLRENKNLRERIEKLRDALSKQVTRFKGCDGVEGNAWVECREALAQDDELSRKEDKTELSQNRDTE